MGLHKNFQRCRLCDDGALHIWLTLIVMVGLLVNYGTPQDTDTVLQPDSVEPYFNSSIVFYKEGENGYYGNNVTVRTTYLQSLANRSWVDYETHLPVGKLRKFYFMAYNYSQLDDASTRIRLQVWRPRRITPEPPEPKFWLLWEQLVQVRPTASVPLVYTYTVDMAIVLNEGDKIGWTFEGSTGPISYQYSESHRTYFTASHTMVWQDAIFESVYLPSVFSIAVSVDAWDWPIAVVMSTRTHNGKPAVALLSGNPDVYLPEIVRNGYTSSATFNITNTSPFLSSSSGPVEVDYREIDIFWSDEHQQTITAFKYLLLDANNITGVVSSIVPLSNQVTGLSLDWVSNLLYWSDPGYKRIGVVDARLGFVDAIKFKKWRIVVDTNLSSPQDVVVYPPQGILFWSDAGSTPKIEMLDLAQDIRRVLVTSPTVQSPKTLVIDYASLRLYWLDTAKAEVSSVKLDGSDYTPWKLSLFSQISSFFIYKQYFVFADQNNPALYFYNGTQFICTKNFTSKFQGISDIVMCSKTRQPYVPSPCTFYNGLCEDFCITTNVTRRKCQCSEGRYLAEDGTSCLTNLSSKGSRTACALTGGVWTMVMLSTVLVFLQIAATN